MKKSTSLYLDFLRVVAALGVLIGHANFPWFSNNLFPGNLGHRFVLIFFVLSGYLIAFTVNNKSKSSSVYLVDRFSRLYSVVLPALLFTYLIDFAGKFLHPGFYTNLISPDHQVVKFLLNVSFLQQIWSLSSAPSSNGPFWSISYEFWYYMIFWVFCYLKGFWKVIGFTIIFLVIGLKILLLLPVWIFGVIAFRLQNKLRAKSGLSLILFLSTLAILLILTIHKAFYIFSSEASFGHSPLFFSSNFVFDWIFGILVAINIYCFANLDFKFMIPIFIQKLIKYFSSITFTLYLFHLPLLIFIASILPYDRSSYFQVVAILVSIIIITSFFSEVTEKQRYFLKPLFGKIFFKINTIFKRSEEKICD